MTDASLIVLLQVLSPYLITTNYPNYDVMKYLCCSICGSMHVSHSSMTRRPTIAGSDNKSN